MFSLDNFGVKRNIGVLNNGSKIFHYYKPNTPLSTAIVFDAGSANDPIGKEGLAHFCEHILFKSTKKFRDETEVGLFMESIGGEVNAFTGVDLMGVTAEIGSSDDFSRVIDFMHELSRESLFEEKRIETERGTILGEIADYEANPALYIQDLTQQVLYQGTYASRSIAGTKLTVNSISRDDLYNFYTSRIVRSNMTAVVAGDMKFDEMLGLFNNTFSEGPLPVMDIKKEELTFNDSSNIMVKEYKDTDQVFMGFSFRTCPYINSDNEILEVIRTTIGGGFSSSLFRKLRTENGLVYSLDVSSDNSYDRGHFSVVTSTSKDRVQKVIDVLTDEFKRLLNGEISEEELLLAKDKMIKSKIRQMQTSGSWVSFHLPELLFNPGNPSNLSDWMNKIEKIVLSDVKKVCAKYFLPGKWFLSMCGDIKEGEVRVDF